MAIIPSGLSKAPGIVTPEQKKQKKLLIIFGIVILITVIFLYYNYFSSPAPSVPMGNTPAGTSISAESPVGSPVPISSSNFSVSSGQQEEIPSLENVQLDFSVFDSPRFTALKEFSSDLDISAIEKGRRNPFLRY